MITGPSVTYVTRIDTGAETVPVGLLNWAKMVLSPPVSERVKTVFGEKTSKKTPVKVESSLSRISSALRLARINATSREPTLVSPPAVAIAGVRTGS